MAEFITHKQAAELRGVSLRRLQYIEKEDNPPQRYDSKTFDARVFGAWLIADATGTDYDYNEERARLTKFQADEKELQVKVLAGDLVPSDQVLEMLQTVISNARAKLLTLPIKAAQAALNATDLKDIEREIKDLVHESLSELNDGSFNNTDQSGRELETATTLNS